MTDYDKLRELAAHVTSMGPKEWFTREDLRFHNVRPADASFIAEATPTAILALLDENEALRRGQGNYEGDQS